MLKDKVNRGLRLLAIVSILVLPLSLLGFRLNLYEFSVASLMLAVSLLLAALVFLVGSLFNLLMRNEAESIRKPVFHAWVLSLIPLVLLGSQIITAKSKPMIHNISTDVVNPPAFNKVIALRGEGANPHVYDAELLAPLQIAAYPTIKTLEVDDSFNKAFNKANLVVSKLEWDLVGVDEVNGVIEATQTSGLWQFKDDVVIRVTRKGDRVNIDLRSVSRIGRSDLGANAKRIEAFFAAYKSL